MDTEKLSRIKTLFEEAQKLNKADRIKFIKTRCGNDEELITEITSLLHSLENTEDFLEAPLKLIDEDREAFADPLLGKQIGNFIIDGEAGIGGMGVVYSGKRNDKEFEQKVAIKILKYGFNSKYHLGRFQIERQTLANLQHPNIAGLLDGGTTADGLPYLVMEYIDGMPVTVYSTKKNLSLNQKLELFRQICGAVQYAHKNLVIHRDIKPGNILVTQTGIPKLLDFGIAKLMDDDFSESDSNLTQTGMWHLTPDYASPEQINGEKITTASDIYSLGILLYQLTTGVLPYKITNNSPAVITKIVTEENILKPSEQVKITEEITSLESIENKLADSARNQKKVTKPEKLSRSLRGDLDNIILKAMHKDPERRYSSVEQFSEDIRRHLAGLPVIAQKDTAAYRLSKFIKRHKIGFFTSLLFFVLLISSVILISWQADKAANERDIAQQESKKAEAVNQFLQQMLSSPDPQESGRNVKVYDVLEKASKEVKTKFKNQPKVAAAINSTIGNTFTNLGEFKEAKKHLVRALELNKKNYGIESKETAASMHDLAEYYDWVGKLKAADTLFNEAENIFENLPVKQPSLMANNLTDYGLLKNDMGNYKEAKLLLVKALNFLENTESPDSAEIATTINDLAVTLDYLKDLDGAEKNYLQAQKIFISQLGKKRPEVASTYNNLGLICVEKKEYNKAKVYLEKSLKLKIELLGKDHPNVGLALNNMGSVYLLTEKYKTAEEYFRAALKNFSKSLKPGHMWFAMSDYWLGRSLMGEKKYASAEIYFKKSLLIREKVFSKNHYMTCLSRGDLGISLLKQNKLTEAEKLLLNAFNHYRNEVGKQDKNSLRFAENLVELYKKKGETIKADHYKKIAQKLSGKI